MAITRGIAAAAILAGLAVRTASPAWADQTMSGHYIETETVARTGLQLLTNDWYFTPCGDGCASLAATPGGQTWAQARLVNGQWTMDRNGDDHCPDASVVPDAFSMHFTWDPNTLAGTVALTFIVQSCGRPVGQATQHNIQLRKAP
jgi:hypothetical protein